jgi:hypothetical protein
MGVLSAISVAEIKARGCIRDADVLKLRRNYCDDSRISAEEADTIFTLNNACPVQDPAWAQCFVETITDYLVEQIPPQGYITAENARWLTERVAREGKVESKSELELIVNVLHKARWAPQSFARFALDQLKEAIIAGRGPLRSGNMPQPALVTEADVDWLRRTLCAYGSDGNLAVTRLEAEVLFDIEEATASADNHRAWPELFIKAIAGAVMAAAGYATPARARALAPEPWRNRRAHPPREEVYGMAVGCGGNLSAYRAQTEEERAIAGLTQQKIEIVTREPLIFAPAEWLAVRIGERQMAGNRRLLLLYLKAADPVLPACLAALCKAAPIAA